MSSDPKIVAFIAEQAGGIVGDVTARAMFGDYALYREGRLVALVCDDRLFVKPTAAGRAFAPDAEEGAPYPGAKPCLVIDRSWWADRDWLTELIQRTAAELPLPKPRAKRIAGPLPGRVVTRK